MLFMHPTGFPEASRFRDHYFTNIIGNPLDTTVAVHRLIFGGVRDFLYWHYKNEFSWPVFNIADCCLVCGAFLLLAQAFWSRPESAGEVAESHALRQEVVEA